MPPKTFSAPPNNHFDGGKNLIDAATVAGEKSLPALLQDIEADIARAVPDSSTALPTIALNLRSNGGDTENIDAALPAGSYRLVDFVARLEGAGTTSDAIAISKGASAISGSIAISSGIDGQVFRPTNLNKANLNFVGGTDSLRLAVTDGGGSDVPVVDVMAIFARTN
jgi:hypothetical protein